ncbi:MAG: UDP-2,4-diacetamido-2,4,6-trideoxy-beta-L-altropyranose hydrolase [Planctomycetes bacterium]|nr:UDP-2,4-diacetamido-2,4,6-trideoxy-beta-L-altropyranose hydrolase [Planctomycetota bacterium]
MKIIILTECGGNIGYGHISRCSSIYQAFEENDLSPELIVYGEGQVEQLLSGKRHRIFDWINNRKLLIDALGNCDIAFIDSYLAGREIYELVSKQVATVVFFDDDLRIDYPKGIVLNGAISAEDMNYPARAGVRYLLGTSYFPLRKEFCNAPAKEIRREVKTLLVTCGGSDMHNLTPTIQTFLNENYPHLHKKIIVTSLFSNISEIQSVQDRNTELLFDLDAVDFREAMQNSDIAISSGGQTLYELASMGLPTIAVSIAENQMQNISGWCKTGHMEYAGKHKDKDFLSNLKRSLDEIMPFNKRSKCSKGTRQFVDGNGAKKICDMVLS